MLFCLSNTQRFPCIIARELKSRILILRRIGEVSSRFERRHHDVGTHHHQMLDAVQSWKRRFAKVHNQGEGLVERSYQRFQTLELRHHSQPKEGKWTQNWDSCLQRSQEWSVVQLAQILKCKIFAKGRWQLQCSDMLSAADLLTPGAGIEAFRMSLVIFLQSPQSRLSLCSIQGPAGTGQKLGTRTDELNYTHIMEPSMQSSTQQAEYGEL